LAEFADDQYLDAIALFAALSTCLRTTGTDHVPKLETVLGLVVSK